MSAVLGLSFGFHDAAAAVVVDGEVAFAIQEERLSGIKNDPAFPSRAANACLEYAKLTARDLDRVVYYEDPYAKLERVLTWSVRTFPRSLRHFSTGIATQLGEKVWALANIADRLGVERSRVICFPHHTSHAASAFYSSPFDRAAILTIDGVGEQVSTGIWRGDESGLSMLWAGEFPHSIGLLYAALTAYLGFEVNEGEYKVMGLSAFGQPRFMRELELIVRVDASGGIELDLDYFNHMTDVDIGFAPKMEKLLGPRREYGAVWDLASKQDRRFADIAASLQALTTEIVVRLARHAREITGCNTLCMAGGVALNAVANARVLRDAGFVDVFVQPAAGDAGGALGAAILGSLSLGEPRPSPMSSASLGLLPNVQRAEAIAKHLGMRVSRVSVPAEHAARLLLDEKIVAHATGRSEWGPRALGNRSILANPRSAATRERLNRIVKHREPFRPFAPVVLDSAADDYFVGSHNAMTPFMTCVCDVVESKRGSLEAITHVDGTARVQVVDDSGTNPLVAVTRALAKSGAPPIVLNTSLNGRGEPIAATTEALISFAQRHRVDAMLIEDLLIEAPE